MTSYYYDVLEPSVQQQGSHMVMKGVSKPLKEKIKVEAMENNLLKRTSHAKLPL